MNEKEEAPTGPKALEHLTFQHKTSSNQEESKAPVQRIIEEEKQGPKVQKNPSQRDEYLPSMNAR